MNNARVKGVGANLEKDKRSEKQGSSVPPEEATHLSDAVDKLLWTKYHELLDNKSSQGTGYLRAGGRSL